MLQHLLKISELSARDLERLLNLARLFKSEPYRRRDLLEGDSVVLHFAKPSTRTRLSMETAVARLGGLPIAVGRDDLQLGRGETIEDTARVTSRYARAFVVRTFDDWDVERFAAAATIPVINALTDGHHPCQAVADMLTLRDKKETLAGLRLAYVGDGNNVARSLVEAAALVGIEMRLATPEGYGLSPQTLASVRETAERAGGSLLVTTEPEEAVADADAVYTDTWLSMGHADEERAARMAAFARFQVDARLMGCAKPDAIFMHCLPDHRGEEVTAEVVDGPRSVVFDQAENRLHTALAIFEALLEELLEGAAATRARDEPRLEGESASQRRPGRES